MNGVFDLWRGLGPTLLRDVPFSMLYWLGYDRFQSAEGVNAMATRIVGPPSGAPSRHRFTVSFMSGCASGFLAAVLTHPFDVVKTRQQAHVKAATPCCSPLPSSTYRAMMTIVQTEGPGALYAGIVARAAKVAPACAIMISSYELGKTFFNPETNVV